MRVAVLVKYVPRPDELRLEDGRLVREGVELEVSAFCRRANAKAVELAGPDGEVVVFTMGPPTAAAALREMLACGATRGVHLCDPRFAGSDTLATARALAAAITAEGPFDLVLCGLNSLDADTGQVGPEVAELLGLPFAPGVRDLELDGPRFRARLETDDGHRSIEGTLPVVLSTAERLCEPSKAGPEERALVDDDRVTVVGADELGLAADQVGPSGSPTAVGPVELHVSTRHGWRTSEVGDAFARLEELGALEDREDAALDVVPSVAGDRHSPAASIHCFLVPGPDGIATELLGEAARLATQLGGTVTAIIPGVAPAGLGRAGADRVITVPDAVELEQRVEVAAAIAAAEEPWALLFEATRDGRAVASAVAARCGWGLTGDAIGLEVSRDRRLVAWKPAFGGQLVAPITSRSPVQMATVRPGIMRRRTPRPASDPAPEVMAVVGSPRLVTTGQVHDDPHVAELLRATAVIGVGTGVQPDEYPLLEPLQAALGGAALAASRKVTDRGWLPRSRQVGVTGHSIAPRLYVAIGISGKLNHMIGVRAARTVLAVNDDPAAPVFEHADVGLVADWRVAVPELVHLLGPRVLGPIGTA
jgi:electron transfer flavoprotein alpha subunit